MDGSSAANASRFKYILIAILSATNAIQQTLQISVWPAILRDAGASLETIALFQVMGAIGLFSFLWSPFIDRHGSRRLGHFRGWVLGLQLLMTLCTLTLAVFNPEDSMNIALIIIIALTGLASTTLGNVISALASRLTPFAERSKMNGITQCAMFLGIIVGGGFYLPVYEAIGWDNSVSLLALIGLLALIPVWMFREEPKAPSDPATDASLQRMVDFVRAPENRAWIGLLSISFMATAGAFAITTPIMVDSGWDLSNVGIAINVTGALFGAGAAVTAGRLFAKMSRKRALVITYLLQGIGILALVLLLSNFQNQPIGFVLVGLIVSAQAFVATIIGTVMMDRTRRETATSDMTLQGTISGLGAMVISVVALALVNSIGYQSVILLLVLLSLLTAAAFLRWFNPSEHVFALDAPAVSPQSETTDLEFLPLSINGLSRKDYDHV